MEYKVLFIDLDSKKLPPGNAFSEKIQSLSPFLSGYIVSPIDEKSWFEIKQIGTFAFLPYLAINIKFPGVMLFKCIHLFIKSLFVLINDKSVKVIIAKTPLYSGFVAIVLAWVTKRKSLIEVNGDFNVSFRYKRPSGPTVLELLKEKIARYLIEFTLSHASAIKLLYPTQIENYKIKNLKNITIESFHDFVPITKIIDQSPADGHYILTLGYPWYLKGVDILIKAFKRLSPEFPQYKLKVHGWCPEEKEYFIKLAEGCANIELNGPVEHPVALSLILNCSVLALASRTEGMGRVLLEAMASSKPIVASNISGIPAVIKDGINGLLFAAENETDLYDKLEIILRDQAYSKKLAEGGFNYVQKYLSEEVFAYRYTDLIKKMF